MAENKRGVQLEVSVDANPAVAGLNQVSSAAKATGDQINDAGKKAADSWAAAQKKLLEFGNEQKKQSEKDRQQKEQEKTNNKERAESYDRATKSIISSIERRTARIEASNKGEAEYFRLLAQQRGKDTSVFEPYLKRLEEAQQKQSQFNSAIAGSANGFKQTEISAKSLSFALRQVPAQMTDIVTSLSAGQPPLQVLLQQGGQLKDLFGGIGAAARALGGYIVTLVTPLNVAIASVATLSFGFLKGAREAQEFNKTLVLTGGIAGVTSDRLMDMARSLDGFGTTQAKGAETLNKFASSGLIAASSLERFSLAAINLERVGGPAVEDTVKAFEELGKNPLTASVKLNESTNFLTKSVYLQIRALTEQNRIVEAAAVAQNAYADAINDRTPQIVSRLGLIERGWIAIKDLTKEAGDALLSIGRSATPQENLETLQKQIAAAEQRRAFFASRGVDVSERDSYIESLKEQAKLIKQAQAAEDGRARAQSESAKEVKDLIALEKERQEVLKESEQWVKKFTDAQFQAQGGLDELTKTQQTLIEFLRSDVYQKMGDPMRQKALAAAYAAIEIEKQVIAEKELAKANAEATKAEFERTAAFERSADTAEKNLARIRTENQAYAVSIEKNISLAEAIELVTVARLREQQAAMMREGDRDVEVLAIQREIDARLEAVAEIRQKKIRDDIEKAAKDAEEAWKRAAQKIEDSIVDALMRGFERGDSIIENLKKTIENTFKTLVLRPIIQAVVSPFSSTISGALGGIQGAGNIGSLLSSASGIQSIYSAVTGGLGASVGSAIANAGTLFGSSALQSFGAGMQGSILGPGMMGPTTIGAPGAMGAGAAFAQVLPYVAAASIAASVLSRPGETRAGGQYGFNFGQGLINERRGTVVEGATLGVNFLEGPSGGASNDEAVRQSITATVNSINALLLGLGSRATLTGFQAGLETSSKGRGGVFAGGALSTGALFGESGRGDNYAGTLFESFSTQSPDAATALKNFSIDLKQATIQALQAASDIPQSISDKLRGIDAERLSEEAANALVQQIASIVDSVSGLKASLSGLPFEDVKNLSFDASASLLEFAGGLENLSSGLNSYYQNFFTAAERETALRNQLESAFVSINLSLPETRQGFRDLVEAQDLSTESGRKTYAALLALSGAFAELTQGADDLAEASRKTAGQIRQEREGLESRFLSLVGNTAEIRRRELETLDVSNRALQERIYLIQDQIQAEQDAITNAQNSLSAAKSATDTAFGILQNSVNSQKQVVQASIEVAREQIDSANSVLSLLQSAVRNLRSGDVSEGARGRDFLSNALDIARSTGYLPDRDQLSVSIDSIFRDLETRQYASAFEQRRDRALLQNQFEELSGYAEDQLTEAERQLQAAQDQIQSLDSILQANRAQLDALRGVDTSVKSVEQAINALSVSIQAERSAMVALQTANATAQANSVSRASSLPPVSAPQSLTVEQLYQKTLGRAGDAEGVQYWRDRFGSTIDNSEIDLFRWAAENAIKESGSNEKLLPRFAFGGAHFGGLRIVGENGPELEATGPARIWDANQTSRMLGGDMSVEIRALREEMELLRYETRATAVNTAKTTKVLERVTRDGESLLVTNA